MDVTKSEYWHLPKTEEKVVLCVWWANKNNYLKCLIPRELNLDFFFLSKGMLSARGEQLLFADADGATTFEDISKLQNTLKEIIKGLLKK